jgi:hypothetical protein
LGGDTLIKTLIEDLEDNYSTINVTYDGQKFYVEYVYTLDPVHIDILSTDYITGHEVDDFNLLQEVNNKATIAILKRINKSRVYI